jgi:hypothetical protein
MEKLDWTPDTLAGLPAYRHKLTKELCAFGARGQLFEYAPGQLRALFYHPDGEEGLAVVYPDQLARWVKRLAIPQTHKEQQQHIK